MVEFHQNREQKFILFYVYICVFCVFEKEQKEKKFVCICLFLREGRKKNIMCVWLKNVHMHLCIFLRENEKWGKIFSCVFCVCIWERKKYVGILNVYMYLWMCILFMYLYVRREKICVYCIFWRKNKIFKN